MIDEQIISVPRVCKLDTLPKFCALWSISALHYHLPTASLSHFLIQLPWAWGRPARACSQMAQHVRSERKREKLKLKEKRNDREVERTSASFKDQQVHINNFDVAGSLQTEGDNLSLCTAQIEQCLKPPKSLRLVLKHIHRQTHLSSTFNNSDR